MSRTCGGCTACCTSLAVHELKKRAFKPCEFICSGGCSIYEERPGSCQIFKCLWLDDQIGLTQEDERPDKSGLVVTYVGQNIDFEDFRRRYKYPPLQIFEAWPGAIDSYRGQKLINRLRRRAIIICSPFDSLDRRMFAPDDYNSAAIEKLRTIALANAQKEHRALLAGELPVEP